MAFETSNAAESVPPSSVPTAVVADPPQTRESAPAVKSRRRRFRSLALWRKLVTLGVRPHVLPEGLKQRLERRSGGKTICYVLEARSFADLAVIERVCQTLELPEPAASFGYSRDSHSVLFLEKRAAAWGSRADRRVPKAMNDLVHAVAADPTLEIDLVPVSIFWGRAPHKEHSWLRLLLAERWGERSRLRRMLSILVNRRNLLVQFGSPVPLRPIVEEAPDRERSVRRVVRMLRTLLRNQRTAAIGPDLSHRRTIVAQMLRVAGVRRAMADEMRSKKISRGDALRVAQRYAHEIAANYSYVFVDFIARALTWVYNHIYEGVEVHNFDSLLPLMEGNELIYVPCHRSHMDYLLLSYVIYYKGYAVPHVAAGDNLNMPVVGSLLRRGGAFFLRRSFRGNTLYTMVFMRYLELMMSRGHSIEYFVEGGRSRTGRLLQPKTGMLSMTLRSYLRDPRRPVIFVPVYFGYERLLEGKTYIGELSGQPKKKESIFDIFKIIPALRRRFGQVHVSFGDSIRLDDVLRRHSPTWSREPVAPKDDRPSWLGAAIDDLSQRIMTNINSAVSVTPINLLALALLATPKQCMSESDLVRQVKLYTSLLRQAPYSPFAHVTDQDGAAVIRYGEQLGMLVRHKHAMGDIIRMTEETSVLMTYFRNNVLHAVALPSLIACCFLNNRTMRTEDIQRLMWRIYPYVCDELFLRWTEEDISSAVVEMLHDLAALGLLESMQGGIEWRRPPTGSTEAVQLSLLAQVTVQIIERYYLAISILLKAGSGKISQESLESQCHLMAQRMSLLYELNAPEFFDKSLFKNFIDLARGRNVLGVNAEGKLTYTEMLLAVSDDARLVLHEQIRNSILQVTHQ
jgi:glycerol-3-phosphate O-acyltransferase